MVQKKFSIKRSNQLRNKLAKQGKLKKKHNRRKIKIPTRAAVQQNILSDQDDDNDTDNEGISGMIEDEDLSFLQSAVKSNSYSFLRNLNLTEGGDEEEEPKRKRKRKAEDEGDNEEYENQYLDTLEPEGAKKYRHLLPVKSNEGLVRRVQEVEDEEIQYKSDLETTGKSYAKKSAASKLSSNGAVSTAELLACREANLQNKKFRIGVLCSSLLENPENKVHNFKPLLEMMEEKDPEVKITVRKLVLVSLLEVFKDLLPAYSIKLHNDSKVKLKKVVQQLHDYENGLVRAYKIYLMNVEKIISILKKKKGDTRVFQEPELKLAEIGLNCLCELIVTHPYFNFSKNIVQLLVPFLDNPKESVRKTVATAITKVFKGDKRGQLSLDIVRTINKLVKTKHNSVRPEAITVFMALKLKDVNLDQEKEEEIKKKKMESKKHKIIRMTRREKKRNKRIQELENEMMETKAEESQKAKQLCLTEITKLVFAIYFRVLKLSPSSKLMGASLEGLAKFAHCINIEFYQDLINVLDNLIEHENLSYKDKLCCVQTVFTVLSYQGATINIDPLRFYAHLYANLLHISVAGKNHSDIVVVLKAMDAVLLKRGKHVSLQRLLAFVKRLSTLSLQLLPNGSLAILRLLKQVLQAHKAGDILLDTDPSTGQGIYYPEMNEPEYCNANTTALWELLPLQRHYHPTVREYANYVAKSGCEVEGKSTAKGFIKESPEQLFNEYDPSEVKFNPPISDPKEFPKKKQARGLSNDMEADIRRIIKQHKDLSDLDINGY